MARIADLLAAGRTFSFEFFPPKTDGAQLSLGRTIAELEPLGPSFVSVTYGAGGTTRERTHEVVTWIRRETAITPMAHLTCAGHRRAELAEILDGLPRRGHREHPGPRRRPARRRGRRPPGDYRYAAELVEVVRAAGPLLARRGRPPRGATPARPTGPSDRRHLAAKLARADFAITQFFFEAEHYLPPGRRAGRARA